MTSLRCHINLSFLELAGLTFIILHRFICFQDNIKSRLQETQCQITNILMIDKKRKGKARERKLLATYS